MRNKPMDPNRIIALGQKWPDGEFDNRYWIGVRMANVQYQGGPPAIGRECRSLDELETVAAQIIADLESTMAEARAKLGSRQN